jgi:hypothetical protein
MEMGSRKGINLDNIKASLAEVAAKLQTQKQLSEAARSQAASPPTEPAGRAPDGMAYER